MSTEQTMVNELLSYLYGSFLITYVLCVIGLLIREILSSSKKNPSPISLKRIIFASIPVTAIICAVKDRFDVSFSMYVLFCLLGGTCSGFICNIFIHNGLLLVILKALSKVVKDPMVEVISDAAENINKQIEEEKKKEEEKNKKKDSKENKDNEKEVEEDTTEEQNLDTDEESKKEEPV